MLGELLIPAWTLFSVSVGVILGYAVAVAAQPDGTDDGPGAVGADELDEQQP